MCAKKRLQVRHDRPADNVSIDLHECEVQRTVVVFLADSTRAAAEDTPSSATRLLCCLKTTARSYHLFSKNQ
jgi:hypothetical protein